MMQCTVTTLFLLPYLRSFLKARQLRQKQKTNPSPLNLPVSWRNSWMCRCPCQALQKWRLSQTKTKRKENYRKMLYGNRQQENSPVEISWFRDWSHTLYATLKKMLGGATKLVSRSTGLVPAAALFFLCSPQASVVILTKIHISVMLSDFWPKIGFGPAHNTLDIVRTYLKNVLVLLSKFWEPLSKTLLLWLCSCSGLSGRYDRETKE